MPTYPFRLHALDEVLDRVERFPDFEHTVHIERDLVRHLGTQRRVQDGSIFGDVDLVAREHRRDRLWHLRLFRKPDQ